MHFGKAEDVCPYGFGPKAALDFIDGCADVAASSLRGSKSSQSSVLDVGCSVGGQSF